jgi:hypothetical protein
MAGPAQPIPALAQIPGATHLAAPDWLGMPTDRFLLILERLLRRQKAHGDWCLVALSLSLAFLIPLITTETYRALFGIKPEMWGAFCMLGVFVFGPLTVGLSVRWAYLKVRRPDRTPEEILNEVVEQMTREQEQANARYAAASAAARPAVAPASGAAGP